MKLTRRNFLAICVGALFIRAKERQQIMTINGPINISKMGKSLIHEHFLVDFIGAKEISTKRWDRVEVVKKVVPYILEAKNTGVKTMFDCTPAFLGRDPILLRLLAKETGMQIVTNTGYYGALDNKHLPVHAISEPAEVLALRWIREYLRGIDGTDVRPGFIKIGVDSKDGLSDMHIKLVKAAAITHLKTGLTICSHTGPGKTAFEQLDIIQKMGVSPSAFVWVHAQGEEDVSYYENAASLGAWISLDGIGWGDFDKYVDTLYSLKSSGYLNRVLISHDAGWFKPGEPDGEFTGYTNIFTELIPKLKQKNFSQKDIDLLLVQNPISAFGIKVKQGRKMMV